MIRFSPIKYLLFGILLNWCSFQMKAQLQCENDTSYLRSLIDLQLGTYLGYQGGLYPDGTNTIPPIHFSSGMNISRQVVPLNASGVLDTENGKAGFICLGASTAGNAFNHFKSKAEADPAVNPCLQFANCAVGAKGLEIMIDTIENGWYWDDEVMPDVAAASLTPEQVQVIWIMVTSRVDTILLWPYQPHSVTEKYEALMPILLAKFPNLKQVFLSGFNYGGYADPTKEFYNMIYEPSSYWNNWSVKFLIEQQIEGDTGLQYSGPDRNSPWLAWGPHLWADGLRPNAVDGLRWNCEVDYKPDGGGYHMSNEGKDKEGKILLDFFKNSPIAADWFRYGPRWVACDPDFKWAEDAPQQASGLNLYPNPSSGVINIEMGEMNLKVADIQVFNPLGQLILSQEAAIQNNYLFTTLNLTNYPNGLYKLIIKDVNTTVVGNIVIAK